MGLYIENLDNYDDYKVVISCGHKSTNPEDAIDDIVGINLAESFSINMDAGSFNNTDSFAGISSDAIGGALSGVAKSLHLGSIGENLAKKYNTVLQSASEWQGGSKFKFSVSFNVFKSLQDGVGKTTTFSKLSKNLAKFTQARLIDDIKLGPQLSYYDSILDQGEVGIARLLAGDTSKKEANLFTVAIGNWFVCSMLQPHTVEMKLSSYVDTTGTPIYATVTIGFETYRVLTAKEWGNIIREGH